MAKRYAKTGKKPRVRKIEWDRDYHTVTDDEVIDSIDEIEDDWTGYNYWYKIEGSSGVWSGPFKADQARDILSTCGY